MTHHEGTTANAEFEALRARYFAAVGGVPSAAEGSSFCMTRSRDDEELRAHTKSVEECIKSAPVGSRMRIIVVTDVSGSNARKTLSRLMRMDPLCVAAGKQSQAMRRKRLVIRSRGGRPWAKRERAARIVQPRDGAAFELRNLPHLWPDLRSVSKHVRVSRVEETAR